MLRKVLGLKCNYKVKENDENDATAVNEREKQSAPRYQSIGSDRKQPLWIRQEPDHPHQHHHGNDTVDSRTGHECQFDSMTPTQTSTTANTSSNHNNNNNTATTAKKTLQVDDGASLVMDSSEYQSIVGQIMNQVMGLQLGSTGDSPAIDRNKIGQSAGGSDSKNKMIESTRQTAQSTPSSVASSARNAIRSDLHINLTKSIRSESDVSIATIASSLKSLARSVDSLQSTNPSITDRSQSSISKTHVTPVATKVRTIATKFEGSDIYKMSGVPRGYCIIINNVTFDLTCFETRNGSDSEAEVLSDVFRQLGFTVMYFKNLCTKRMLQTFKRFRSSGELAEHDALVCIIMSHGDSDKLVGSDGLYINVDTIVGCFNNFNCPALINKPRLFFIQACRGQCRDFGVLEKHTVADAVPRPMAQVLNSSGPLLPCWTDTLIVYSTVQGYVSMRNELSGSWFGHALSEVLMDKACDTELYQLMIEVSIT